MPLVKIKSNRQVTIPKNILDELGLQEGDFVEITRSKKHIMIKPRKLADLEDTLTFEEEKIVEKGFEQLKQKEYVIWEESK